MFLTMIRFKVKPGAEDVFETVWANRKSHLRNVPGFLGFHMMRCKPDKSAGYRLYASHTMWETEAAFLAWTKSTAFRQAHKGAGDHGDLYAEAPHLEVFESIASEIP